MKVFSEIRRLRRIAPDLIQLGGMWWVADHLHKPAYQQIVIWTAILWGIIGTFGPSVVRKWLPSDICNLCGGVGAHQKQCPISIAHEIIIFPQTETGFKPNLSESELKVLFDKAFAEQLKRARDEL